MQEYLVEWSLRIGQVRMDVYCLLSHYHVYMFQGGGIYEHTLLKFEAWVNFSSQLGSQPNQTNESNKDILII